MKQLLFAFCLLLPLMAFGQNCETEVSSFSGDHACVQQNGFIGQAFVPCETGKWDNLTFNIPKVIGSGSFTLYVADGEIADKTLSSAQSFGPYTGAGLISVNPDRIVSKFDKMIFWVELNGFNQVCFECANAFPPGGEASDFVHSALAGGSPNPNSSGSLVSRPSSTSSARSTPHVALAFTARISPSNIPSLSEWGLIIFGLITLNLGIFFIQKKEEIIV